ncbi:MAG: hypothetical protein ABJE95_14360 [Byssovorax sp.]
MKRAVASGALLVALSGCDWLPPPPPPSSSVGAAGSSGSGGAGGSGGSTATASSSGSGGSALACATCDAVEETGKLVNPAQIEISGIVASLTHDDVFYVHNDSGDTARFFAINSKGAALATFAVNGAQAVDWEDIARGPCPAGTCIYLGDIGDNSSVRTGYAVYRVTEPKAIVDTALPAETLAFTYPDGPHNAETLLVDPATGGLFVVTKTVGTSSVYAFPMPLTPGKSVVLTKAGDLSLPVMPALITGGDVHPDGRGVLIRTYSDVWLFPQAKGMSVVDALLGTPCPEPAPNDVQGEAIGWLASGAGYLTTSEGVNAPIHRVKCVVP